MKKKSLLIISFAMILSLSVLFTGCKKSDKKDDAPATTQTQEITEGNQNEGKITDGIFELKDPDIDLKTFLRFNEDGSYYGYFFDGGVVEAGTYELLDEEMEYISDPGPDGEHNTEDDVMDTAPQTIVVTSYQGETVRYAYDKEAGKILDATLGSMAYNRLLEHNPDYPYDPGVDELAIVIHTYYADNREGASLLLNHNRTFIDVTGDDMIEGTWEISGENVYTLTPDGEDGEYKLTISEDPRYATYTTPDGEKELSSVIQSADQLALSFKAEDADVGLPMGVDVRIDGFSDNTAKVMVFVEQVDADLEVDSGTFEEVDGNYVFHFEKGGDITSEGESVHYKADVTTDFAGNETPMSIDLTLKGGPVAAEVVMTFEGKDVEVGLPMGVDMRIDCYSDGTAKVIVYVAQVDAELVADEGTYTVEEVFNYTFKFDAAGEIAGEPDYDSATGTSINVSVPYAAETSVTFMDNETPLTMDADLEGLVSVE